MLPLESFLCMVLLGLSGYLTYSLWTLYQTDKPSKKAIMQAGIIQTVQMLLIIVLTYKVFTTSATQAPMSMSY